MWLVSKMGRIMLLLKSLGRIFLAFDIYPQSLWIGAYLTNFMLITFAKIIFETKAKFWGMNPT